MKTWRMTYRPPEPRGWQAWKVLCLCLAAATACGGGGGESAGSDTEGGGGEDAPTQDAGDGGADGLGGDGEVTEADAAGAIPWSAIPAEDHLTVARRGESTAPAYDVAWLGDGRLGVCRTDGALLVDADSGGEQLVELPYGCARLVATKDGDLAVDRRGGVVRILAAESTWEWAHEAADGAPLVRAAAQVGDAIFAAAEGAGLVARSGDEWNALGAATDAFDLAPARRGGKDGLLVATAGGVQWWELEGETATLVSAMPLDGGAWRVSAIDGGAGAGPLFAAGPKAVFTLSESGMLDATATTYVRVSPVDVAPLGACGFASGWAVLTRLACGEPSRALESEEFAATSGDIPVDHISAVAASAAGRLAVGTRQGWAVLDAEPEAGRSADIYLPRRSVQFGATPAGEDGYVGFRLANDGSEPLLVSSMAIEDPRFRIDIDPSFAGDVDAYTPAPVLVVDAGGAPGFVQIVFTSDGPEEIHTELVIATNDPDEETVRVPVVANRPNLAAGDPLGDIFLPDVRGRLWELSAFDDRVTYFKLFNST